MCLLLIAIVPLFFFIKALLFVSLLKLNIRAANNFTAFHRSDYFITLYIERNEHSQTKISIDRLQLFVVFGGS